MGTADSFSFAQAGNGGLRVRLRIGENRLPGLIASNPLLYAGLLSSMKKPKSTPTKLQAFGPDGDTVMAVIETPKGSRNKYKFEPKLNRFVLSKVLPEGMVFPYDFGYIPGTKAEDGDPFDVLLLMDEPAFCGCVVECRLIGIIEGEQKEDGKTERNDRLLATCIQNHQYSDLRDIDDVNKQLLKEVGEFFVDYHRLSGTKYKVIGTGGPRKARKLLEKSIKNK